MRIATAKTRLAAVLEAAGYTLELLLRIGLLSGAAIAAVLGQLVLAGVLCLIAFGVFLRFKRRRISERKPELVGSESNIR
jgi:hypothetical protein